MPRPLGDAIARRDVIEGLGKGLRGIDAFDEDRPRVSVSEVGAPAACRARRRGATC